MFWVPIAIRFAASIGTKVAEFIMKNPRIVGATVSTVALSEAVKQTFKNEEEQRQFIREMDEKYPGFAKEYAKPNGMFYFLDVEKILFALGLIIIIYLLIKS